MPPNLRTGNGISEPKDDESNAGNGIFFLTGNDVLFWFNTPALYMMYLIHCIYKYFTVYFCIHACLTFDFQLVIYLLVSIFDIRSTIPTRSIGSKNCFEGTLFGHLPREGGDRGEVSEAANTGVNETSEKGCSVNTTH